MTLELIKGIKKVIDLMDHCTYILYIKSSFSDFVKKHHLKMFQNRNEITSIIEI